MIRFVISIALGSLIAIPLSAKESLGIYATWAAFRDEEPQRCYAIAKPRRASDTQPSASISNWPSEGIRGQVHFRLSREVSDGAAVRLIIGERRFDLFASGRNAWAENAQMDAAIVAALRSADEMRITARDTVGRRFTDRYDLAGAATAMDAALVACAGMN